MNDPTSLDLVRAKRIVDEANAPESSLAEDIKNARERLALGQLECAPSVRPKDRKGAERWNQLQAAKARVAAYDRDPDAHRPSPMPAHQPAAAKLVAADPEPPTTQPTVQDDAAAAKERRRVAEAERKIHVQQHLDALTQAQREARDAHRKSNHPYFEE